ncbi:hypothetical protein PILCRDRAFT_816965 [Piloderma croceum F 1598]|uniref:RING-type domain-containing protein n=1 Tax=Piloderma croceum (strain F 1598) TaxID=765440 RepID=A0A0C3C7U0_PILCF|nr:hypothetical protein PILCRDRAFT_816965 [Piloderma croceum F 1598]
MPVPATAPNTPARNNRYTIPVAPRTPLTATSSPYTPLSTRYNNSYGSPLSYAYASSNATTPGSAYSTAGVKKLVLTRTKGEDREERERSLADIADNWRSRASENGIRVSCSEGDGDADDEASNSSKGKRTYTQSDNPLGPGYVPNESLLPPPFFSTHRRARARAHSQSQTPAPAHTQSLIYTSNSFESPFSEKKEKTKKENQSVGKGRGMLFFSPQPKSSTEPYGDGDQGWDAVDEDGEGDIFSQGYSPTSSPTSISSVSHSFGGLTSTPPVRRPLLTSAPQSLRRSNVSPSGSFSPLRSLLPSTNQNQNLYTPSQTPHANKLRLRGSLTEPLPRTRSHSLSLTHTRHTQTKSGYGRSGGMALFDIEEDGDGCEEGQGVEDSILGGGAGYPYGMDEDLLGKGMGMGEGLNDPFFAVPFPARLNTIKECLEVPPTTTTPPISHPPAPQSPSPTTNTNTCSVCGTSNPLPKAILIPCSHPLCSACLTSALNIVGEKDMECFVCKGGVRDFRLVGGGAGAGVEGEQKREEGQKDGGDGMEGSFEFFEDVRARSSPPPVKPNVSGSTKLTENVVLRIDNVPWDITPPQIRAFFSNPLSLTTAHVLLDRRGKTLSHAFVEFNDEEAARAALRGAQKNSVLGKGGKRARGVTVTRSDQRELMYSLFPSWKGTFDKHGRPSVPPSNNNNNQPPTAALITTLQTGLLTPTELSALSHLIRSPDAHFLKVHTLPFWSVVSLLKKFPGDGDSRVFWGGVVRDGLFEVLVGAVGVLGGRCAGEGEAGGEEEEEELLREVFEAGMQCAIFTPQQRSKLIALMDNTPFSYGSSPLSASDSPPSSPIPHLRTPETHRHPHHSQSHSHQLQPQPQVQIRHHSNPTIHGHGQGHGYGYGYGYGYAEPFSALAREFGVEAQLVEALAQRLAAL